MRVTVDRASESGPLWTPDGRRMVFDSRRNGPLDLYQRRMDASEDEPLLRSSQNKRAADWSPDGGVLLYLVADRGVVRHLGSVVDPPKAVPGRSSAVLKIWEARFSPTGNWIAYQSTASGRFEIYLRPFRGGAPMPVSIDGGTQPQWRGDGDELFFLGLDGRLMAATIKFTADGLTAKGK